MNIADVMDDLGAALSDIQDLRVSPYWADRISPPSAIVSWPDPLTYDESYGRGADRMEIPINVAVGKVDARSSRDALAAYADGSGQFSVKAAIEAHEATAYNSARVTRCEFGVVSIAGIEYLSATFFVDIIGTGA